MDALFVGGGSGDGQLSSRDSISENVSLLPLIPGIICATLALVPGPWMLVGAYTAGSLTGIIESLAFVGATGYVAKKTLIG